MRGRALRTLLGTHFELLVWLIAAHSVAVGLMLLAAPGWAAAFAGWRVDVQPLFFVRQAGVFHFVAVFAYLWELRRTGGVTILVTTKAIAFVFLMTAWVAGEVAWSVPFSGLADGALGVVAWLAWRERRGLAASAGRPLRRAG